MTSDYIVADPHDPDAARELAARVEIETARRSCDRRDPPAWTWKPPKEREQRLPRRNQRRR